MTTTRKEMFPFPIIRKRDGRMTRFDIEKIASAIHKSFYATGVDNPERCQELAEMVVEDLVKNIEGNVPQVEEIQDAVERILIREGFARQAKAYILYRAKRTSIREGKSELMDSVETILRETRKETPFAFNSPSAKMLKIAAAASRNFYLTRLIPSQFSDAHNRGDIHIHDLDYYGKTINSLQIPLNELLKNGFYSGYGYIRPPKHVSTIAALTAIIIQSCQNDMYGGQSIPEFDRFVADYIQERLKGGFDDEDLLQSMEGLVYNLNMIYSRMGAQVPMSTINLGLDTSEEGRKVTGALLKAVEKGLGRGETPLFPWIVFHLKDGINAKEGDPNYDLYQQAVKVACRRMNPVFAFMDSPINDIDSPVAYWGDGSRAEPSLSGRFRKESEPADNKTWGWGNVAQVTINMPRIAFKIAHKRKDFKVESFYSEIRRAMELCARQLLHRKDILGALHRSELPFVMGEKVYRGTSRLASDETIDPPLEYGIMTIGFVGLAEALYIMYGRDHASDEERLDFALKTVDFMKEKAEELSREFEANFVLTASSSGYAAQRFPQLDRIEFGITPMVNDKKYYSQSFSIPASVGIPWEKKVEIEGKFHRRIPGGHFTYLEADKMPDPGIYHQVLNKMKTSGVALGGVCFPLTESLEDGSIITDKSRSKGRTRTIRRAAGLLLPLDRINEALKEELDHRKFDLRC